MAKGKESLTVGNCEEYLNAVSAGFHPATNHGNEISTEFVHDCFVLRDLQHARAHRSAEAAEIRGESWKQFDPDLKVTRTDSDSLNAGRHLLPHLTRDRRLHRRRRGADCGFCFGPWKAGQLVSRRIPDSLANESRHVRAGN